MLGQFRHDQDAKQMLAAAEAKAGSIGIAYNIAVIDARGYLLAFLPQGGALIGSLDLEIDKTFTARIFNMATSELATLAQSGRPMFGIQESNAGKVVIFAGGIPVRDNGTECTGTFVTLWTKDIRYNPLAV